MTRSVRKAPIVGVTTAEADAPFKAREHRRERRAVRAALQTGCPPPDARVFGDLWKGDKDGKQFLAGPRLRDMRT